MEKVKIKDFTNVITGGTPLTSKPEYWENGNIPWLNSGELNQKFVTFSRNYITKLGLEKSSTRLMPEDTVLMALTGSTTGVVGYLTFEACANQSVTGILPSKNHVSKYLYYYLNHIRPKVLNDAYGGAQPHISQGYVKELEIPLPNLATQQKIAKILDKADELRQYNKQLIEKYEALTQSLFLDMFGDIKSNSKGWNTTIFENIISLKRGYDLPHNSRINGNIPVVASAGIVGYHNVSKVKTACIVTGRSGSIGKIQLIKEDCWPLNTSLYGYKTFNNNLIYLKFFVEHFNIERFSHGAGVPTLDRKLVHQEIAPIVPKDLQNQFAERVAVIETQKLQAQEALEKSEALFQGLLQQAFNGELNTPPYGHPS